MLNRSWSQICLADIREMDLPDSFYPITKRQGNHEMRAQLERLVR